MRKREITVADANNGRPCPELVDIQPCAPDIPCHDDCLLSDWSEWSDCEDGVQTRSRTSANPHYNASLCGPLAQNHSCNVVAAYSPGPGAFSNKLAIGFPGSGAKFSGSRPPTLNAHDVISADAILYPNKTCGTYVASSDLDALASILSCHSQTDVITTRSAPKWHSWFR